MKERQIVSTIDGLLSIAMVVLVLLAVVRVGKLSHGAELDSDAPTTGDLRLIVNIRVKRLSDDARPLLASLFPKAKGWKCAVLPAGDNEFAVFYFAAQHKTSTGKVSEVAHSIPLSENVSWLEGYQVRSITVSGDISSRTLDKFRSEGLKNSIDVARAINDMLPLVTRLQPKFVER